ncbi:MAG: 16S rRNA (cytosine(967)-C(5))-methyltransferase RsmB [Rhodothermaceae bacterium]|nr:16S rRNA (cytosine(967)-C(5))-methyltransferase RsmB [Rhodothermaceae bacterium]
METALNARLLSMRVLERFDKTQELDLEPLSKLDHQDRQQANEYIHGIFRRRSYLDFLISHFSSIQLEEMEPFFRNLLRVGIYDLLFMDGTPDYAAINEAVEIAKKQISSKTGDLTNAILRRMQRELDSLPKPDFEDRTKLIATTFSHPEWMVERWVNLLGEREAFMLMQANNQRPSYYVRVNNLKTKTENFLLRMEKNDIEFEESDWLPGYYRVNSINPFRTKGWFDKGVCFVQDVAAGFAPTILDPQPGESVYDLCAAPGTKTLLMANLMENKGAILAVDIAADRMHKIADNAEKFGAEIVKLQRADVIEERFKLTDAVLLDVPCTGTGVLSKRADLRWRRTLADLKTVVETQAELLDAAANMVKRGGRLVYSTCSLEPEENMQQIEKFLTEYDNFELDSLDDYLPEEVLIEDGKAYQTWPHKHNCDGHFGVRLLRVK